MFFSFKISSLQEQLQSAQTHATQYKEISEANEKALQELNKTSEEFTTKLNTELERLQVSKYKHFLKLVILFSFWIGELKDWE